MLKAQVRRVFRGGCVRFLGRARLRKSRRTDGSIMPQLPMNDVSQRGECPHEHTEALTATTLSSTLSHCPPGDSRAVSRPLHLGASQSQEPSPSHEHTKLLLDINVEERLRACVIENRCLRAQEEKVDKDLAPADNKLASLRRQIAHLEKQIREIEGLGARHEMERLPDLYAKLRSRQEVYDRLSAEYGKVERNLEQNWREQRRHVHELLNAFGELLGFEEVQDGLDNGPSEGPLLNIRSILEDEAVRDGLPRKPRTEGVPQQNEKATTDHPSIDIGSAGPSRPVDNYLNKRLQLHDAEYVFYNRQKVFDQERRRRREQIAAGEEIESQTVFDHGQLQATRTFAQYLARAEAEFQAVKAEAIANGAQVPGSDVSSGFVDNDGDRPSLEADEEGTFNLERIAHWVESFSKVANEYQSTDEGTADGVEVENWCPKDIEICDSWSARADGKYRLKIDRWREERGLDF
jgi:hypothetical protein